MPNEIVGIQHGRGTAAGKHRAVKISHIAQKKTVKWRDGAARRWLTFLAAKTRGERREKNKRRQEKTIIIRCCCRVLFAVFICIIDVAWWHCQAQTNIDKNEILWPGHPAQPPDGCWQWAHTHASIVDDGEWRRKIIVCPRSIRRSQGDTKTQLITMWYGCVKEAVAWLFFFSHSRTFAFLRLLFFSKSHK